MDDDQKQRLLKVAERLARLVELDAPAAVVANEAEIILSITMPHGRCAACGCPNRADGCCSRAGCCNSD